MNYSDIFFSYEGRLNRFPYMLNSIILRLTYDFLFFILNAIFTRGVATIVIIFVLAFYLYLSFCNNVKHSHDLNKSGSFAILCLFSIVSLYAYYCLIFIKGTEGSNQYGDDLLKVLLI